jgi:two-component system chemotaxis response regulator CheB
MAKIRVLVVEDSLTVRRRLIEVLASDAEIEVVGEASDGKSAIEMCETLRPNVVTLDMMLPVMTGLAATEYIMAHCPTPILIVSASVNRGELFRTYDALSAGALEVLDKPTGEEVHDEWERDLVATVKLISRIKVITHPRARLAAIPKMQRIQRAETTSVIAIGASTGGPGAVLEVLRALPAPFPLPILLTIHIGKPFGTALAEWLDSMTAHRVAFAQDGEDLAFTKSQVLMAPPDQHLELHGRRIRLSSAPERHSCRPSVDVLFESVAREAHQGGAGCLLTGMGRDGAAGLLAIRRAGGLTIAQDEASSTVYGMPREAAILNAASRILPLSEIGPALAALVKQRGL